MQSNSSTGIIAPTVIMLDDLIAAAKLGDSQAVKILRDMCHTAAEKAPVPTLLKVVQFYYGK